ncbi:hypothetical protein G3I40_19320 [Streptomyces sp. SID14478]|uniref:hypothetical protein n=1 Tax=Streptomyces sp. SID14478 TaxID=2706073 RepID=UPI0013DD725F|nr:hypothetical protein [Streptomyces sp. SID14478]NEB77354.1 hypothetical protein [Streptomyces sp. SID14478]
MAEVWIFRPEQGDLPRRLFRAADIGSIWLEGSYQLRAGMSDSSREVILALATHGEPDFPELFDWRLQEQIDRCRADASEPSFVLVCRWVEGTGMDWVPYTRQAYEVELEKYRAADTGQAS